MPQKLHGQWCLFVPADHLLESVVHCPTRAGQTSQVVLDKVISESLPSTPAPESHFAGRQRHWKITSNGELADFLSPLPRPQQTFGFLSALQKLLSRFSDAARSQNAVREDMLEAAAVPLV